MEDLARYLDEIVEPTIDDLRRNPTSLRLAFLACVAAFHSIDYLACDTNQVPRKGLVGNLKDQFRKESEAFALIDDVAHAFKHVSAGKRTNPNLRAKEVIARPPAVWDAAVWDLSRWDDRTGGVTLEEDRQADLLDALERTLTFLREET
jgi:hypothetical protein